MQHVKLVPPLLEGDHTQFGQPLLVCSAGETRHHPHRPLLLSLQAVRVSLRPWRPRCYREFQMRPNILAIECLKVRPVSVMEGLGDLAEDRLGCSCRLCALRRWLQRAGHYYPDVSFLTSCL